MKKLLTAAAATAIALSLVAPPVAAFQPVPIATLSKKEQKKVRAASVARNLQRVEQARQLKNTRKRELAEAQKAKKDTKSVPGSTRYMQLTAMEADATARLEAATAAKFQAKTRLSQRKNGSLADFVAGHDARALRFWNENNAAANRQAAAARQASRAAATAQTSASSSSAVAQTSASSSSATAQTSSASSSAAPPRPGALQFVWPEVPGASAQTASSSSAASPQGFVGQLRRPAAYDEASAVRGPQGAGYTPGPLANAAPAGAQTAATSSVLVGVYAGAPPQQAYSTPRALVAAVNRDLRQQAQNAQPQRSSEGGYDQPNSTLKQ